MEAASLSVRQFDAPFGAEITGVDACRELAAGTARAIRDAIDRDIVIVLRNQKPRPDHLVRFTAYLGEIAVSVLSPYLLEENQAVSVILMDLRGQASLIA